LFPTVSKVGVQNTFPWRDSGSVVQLAFMCELERIHEAGPVLKSQFGGCGEQIRALIAPTHRHVWSEGCQPTRGVWAMTHHADATRRA
jgi:hypothetical protein